MSLETCCTKSSTAGRFEGMKASTHRLGAEYSILLSRDCGCLCWREEGRQGDQLVAAAVDCHGEILPFLLIILITTP